MKKLLFTILFGILILAPLSVSAAGINDALGNLGTVTKDSGLKPDITASLGTVISTALSLVGTIFLGLMIYAGILWMTAMGKEEKVEKAKDIIIASIIGLAVVMSAYAITFFVTSKLTGGGGGGAVPQTSVPTPGQTPEAPPPVCCEQCESGLGVEACDSVWVDQGTCVVGKNGCPADNTCTVVTDQTNIDLCNENK